MGFLSTLTSLPGTALSFASGAKYWLVAIVVASAAAGAFGYVKGSDHVLTKTINATTSQLVSATAAGARAQATQDDQDARKAKVDYEKRLLAANQSNVALAALLKNKSTLVPHNAVCKVLAPAMSTLNDPDLVGETE